MSSANRPSKTESRIDFEVTQTSHGFSVGTILTHTGSAYAAAINTDEIVGVVSEVADSNNFTLQTSGRVRNLSGLTAGTQYYVSTSSAGTATTTSNSASIYVAVSTTSAVLTIFKDTTGSGSSDLVLISTATASSSSSVSFTGLNSTYTTYFVEFINIMPASEFVELRMRTSTNNGSSYDSGASDYLYSVDGTATNLTSYNVAQSGLSGADHIKLTQTGIGAVTGEGLDGRVTIRGSTNTSWKQKVYFEMAYDNGAPNTYFGQGIGMRQTLADVDAIQFYMSSGNIASGTFKLYGIK